MVGKMAQRIANRVQFPPGRGDQQPRRMKQDSKHAPFAFHGRPARCFEIDGPIVIKIVLHMFWGDHGMHHQLQCCKKPMQKTDFHMARSTDTSLRDAIFRLELNSYLALLHAIILEGIRT